MPLLNIEDPANRPASRFALFSLGFRPFFLFAGIAAFLLVFFWIHVYTSGSWHADYYGMVGWHSHEMIFGYSVAVIAGFLLTTVHNWTGMQTASGKSLALLVALWIAGRLVPFFSHLLPHWIIALIDAAFLPVLAVSLAVPLLRKRQTNNLVFLFVLAALTVANVMMHLQALGLTHTTAIPGIQFAVYLVVLLITILGGRVIPFFTEKGITGAKSRKWKAVEILALGSLILLIALDLTGARPQLIIVIATIAAIGHGLRLYGWYHRKIWSVPLLWILHLAYTWLVVGLLLKAMSAAGLINPALATHALTSACIGSMTLGMMARVALGHTGRVLGVASVMTWAFVLINLAGVSRVFLPLIIPGNYNEWVILAGVLWSLAFVIFVFSYAGMLLRPRIDGRPG